MPWESREAKREWARKTQYPGSGSRRWTPEEDRRLQDTTITDRELSKELRRSMVAIMIRRHRLRSVEDMPYKANPPGECDT